MLKRAVAFTLIIAFILQLPGMAYPGLTDPDDLSKGIKLGLDLASATADSKSSIEGAKNVARKELDDWTWKYVVANYETLLTQNADAEIPDFREKINKLQEFIDRVGQIATQLGEGKYDEAAFTAVDQAVSSFDHPVITVLWASVKLTYESHKLVQDTKAALQIEQLYGRVNHDRLIVGSSSGDAPKQININSQTVDRFFFEYLIKDDATRELMKAYVKVRLGQEWPELSTTDWLKSFMLLGTGIDAQKSHEIEQLTEFKNISRQWIAALLNDINKQVELAWHAARARQLQIEFDAYAARMKGFSADQIIESFRKRKEMLKAKETFPKFLAESAAAYQKLSGEFGGLKNTQVTRMHEIYSAAVTFKGNADTYSRIALMVSDLPLSNQLEKESITWGKFADDIHKSVKENQEFVDDAVVEAAVEASVSNRQGMSCYGNFSPALPKFSFYTSDPEEVNKEVLGMLNSGQFKEARDLIDKWYSEEMKEVVRVYDESLEALAKAAQSAPDFAGGAYFTGRLNYSAEKINPIEMTQRSSGAWSAYRSQGYIKKYVASNKLIECTYAGRIADEAAWASFISFQALINESKAKMDEVYGAFASLAYQRSQELAALRQRIAAIALSLDMAGHDESSINAKPYEVSALDDAKKFLQENTYTYIGKLNEEGYALVSLHGYMEGKAKEISDISRTLESYMNYFSGAVSPAVKRWEDGIENAQELEEPDSDTIDQFVVLVDRRYDHEKEFLAAKKRAEVMQSYVSTLQTSAWGFISSAETEISNRAVDAGYLRNMARQWRIWLIMQIENGVLERNYTPTGVPIASLKGDFDGDLRIKQTENSFLDFTTGMLILSEPYLHYATVKEITAVAQIQKARQDLQRFQVYSFVQSNMPRYADKLERLLSGGMITPAKEENFFIRNNPKFAIYKSAIGMAEQITGSIDPEKDDFTLKMKEISELFPGTFTVQTDPFYGDTWGLMGVDEMDRTGYSAHEMGKAYLALQEKLSAVISERRGYLQKKFQENADREAQRQRIDYFTQQLARMNAEIDTLPSGLTEDTVNYLNTKFYGLYNSYLDQKLFGLENPFKALENRIFSLRGSVEAAEGVKIQQVRDFYGRFKQAYEERDDYRVVSFLGDDWEAGDGTTLSDLQENFSRTFRAFDEISYSLQNMMIEKYPLGGYLVSYDVTITSRIYSRNIKHEEKSSVSEIVGMENGKAKITRTLNGRFWYVE